MSQYSDTTLIQRLRAGRDSLAAQQVWQRYFNRLVDLARKKLLASSRRARDEEDIALSAFDSFFRGVQEGRFPKLDDRADLWQVLVMLTERKAIDHLRRLTSRKRGGGEVRGESIFENAEGGKTSAGIDQYADAEPTPEFVAMFTEECRHLLDRLEDEELRLVALHKLEGYSNAEIAQKLGRATRSVERKLQAIRKVWQDAASD